MTSPCARLGERFISVAALTRRLAAAGLVAAAVAGGPALPLTRAEELPPAQPEAVRDLGHGDESVAVPGGTVGRTVPVEPAVMRPAPSGPPRGASPSAGDAVEGPLDPGSPAPANQADPQRGRSGDPITPKAAAREMRGRMREYGERYSEAIRERHENGGLVAGPAGPRWLSEAERNQFREALRERYHQQR